MKTASYFHCWGWPGRIGISRGIPLNMPPGYRLARELNPGPGMLGMPAEQFEAAYAEILGRLDPQAEWDRLHELAAGAEPLICCWEHKPAGCHRRLVSAWFASTLRIIVPELEV